MHHRLVRIDFDADSGLRLIPRSHREVPRWRLPAIGRSSRLIADLARPVQCRIAKRRLRGMASKNHLDAAPECYAPSNVVADLLFRWIRHLRHGVQASRPIFGTLDTVGLPASQESGSSEVRAFVGQLE